MPHDTGRAWGNNLDCEATPVDRPFVIALSLEDEPVVFAGGGRAATPRIQALVEAGARVTVIAPDIAPALRDWVAERRVCWIARTWQPVDIERHAVLLFAATSSAMVNRAIVTTARRLGKLVCSVDADHAGNFAQVGNVTAAATIEAAADRPQRPRLRIGPRGVHARAE